MRSFSKSLLAVLLLAGFAHGSNAQSTAAQQVTIVIAEVSAIAVSAPTVTLQLTAATPGGPFTDATDQSTTYSLTTNGAATKITGHLSTAYAAGITLAAELAAPASGGTAVKRTLTTTPQDLVTGLSNTNEAGLTIGYTASAPPSTVPNVEAGGETHTVTFTITN